MKTKKTADYLFIIIICAFYITCVLNLEGIGST